MNLRIAAAKVIFALGCIAMLMGPWAPNLETWALLTIGSLVVMGIAWALIKWPTPVAGEQVHSASATSRASDEGSK